MLTLLTGPMATLLLVIALFVAAALRKLLGVVRNRRAGGSRGLGATATEELHALLYPSKRVELEQRRIELVLRDDEHDGAPKRTGIDLDAGTARITRA
jgi:molybdenum-dependent DNA-binding transcriptional regulator ModE